MISLKAIGTQDGLAIRRLKSNYSTLSAEDGLLVCGASALGTPITRRPGAPAQSRTCSFPAPGSSVVLAFARTFTVARYKAQLLLPSVRLARVYPILHVRHAFPLGAAYFRRVLRHVAGFPNLGPKMPDKTPRQHTAVASLPGCSMLNDSTRAHAVSRFITLTCPNTDSFIISLHPGARGASRVLRRLCSGSARKPLISSRATLT